jgi:potassium efflux system protein
MWQPRWAGIFLGVMLALALPGNPVSAADDTSRIELLAAEVAEAREALANLELAEATQAAIGERLDQAAARLVQAAEWRTQADELARLIPTGPSRIEALEADLAAVDAIVRVIPEDTTELGETVVRSRAEIARLETELSTAQSNLADLRERPVANGARLPQSQTELGQLSETATASAGDEELSPRQAADRLRERAELETLAAEVAALEMERDTQPLRERLATLRIQLLERRLAADRVWLATLDQRLGEQVGNELDGLRRKLAELTAALTDDRDELREATGEMKEWIGELEEISRGTERLGRRSDRMRDELESLRRENERLRRQIALGGFEGAFTQLLLEQRQRLLDRRTLDYNLKLLDQEITAAQLRGLQIEDSKRTLRQNRERWRGDALAEPLLQLSGELLDRLDTAQRTTIRELTRLGADQKVHRDLTVEFSSFLSDQLFWRRSSPPLDAGFFRGLVASFKAWLSVEGAREISIALKAVLKRRPIGVAMAILVLAGLLAVRHRLRASIRESGRRIRRISTDRMSHTLLGLLATLAHALPLPLALGALSLSLVGEPDPGPWVRGTARWLGWAAWMLMWILPLRAMAAEGGIGREHFGWPPEACDALRRALKLLTLVYLPPVFVASVAFYDRLPQAFDSLGRLAFVAGQVGLIWVLAGLFNPSTGVFASIVREDPKRLLSRMRGLWFGLIVGIPSLLVVLAAIGYTLTAFVLADRFLGALRWVAAGVIIYGLFLRWLMINQRRIALRETIELRRARREAMAREEPAGDESGAPPATEDDQVQLELSDVVRQTRRLARSLVGIGVIVAVSHGVASGLPLEQAGDNLAFLGDWPWLTSLRALLMTLVTVTLVKYLPGLLDMAGLRGSGMSPGSRYALSTLGQYAIAAIGFFMVAGELQLDWSRFGWIAAALSVGLGFGLQEIVANFVCGIILLFERPIRVGDVVTVGDVTGSVSKIRMRATTITNWERQEFIVPNKEFITGSLINWTLSNTLNRINIPVGVAYGTDTARARRILTEIAEAHPQVLADPAPLAVFEAFGDSTLDLVLRCFLPSLENRARTLTELHEEIDRRFAEAGIEIAFPQRDLHLRGMPEAWSPPPAGAPK